MRTDVQFGHMDRSESLEAHAIDKFETVVDEFLNRDDYHLRIWLITEKSRRERGAPEFKAEASVRFPPKKEIFVSKSADDMHYALNLAASALETKLREYSKRELKRAHTGPKAAVAAMADVTGLQESPQG